MSVRNTLVSFAVYYFIEVFYYIQIRKFVASYTALVQRIEHQVQMFEVFRLAPEKELRPKNV